MSPVTVSGWTRLADSADVTEQPKSVDVDGMPYVLLRDRDGQPALIAARCPHRLVPLDAGRVTDGVVKCRYHGWEFSLDGTCLRVPSMGDAEVPRGAHLPPAPQVAEDDGAIWVEPLAAAGPGRGGAALTNVHPALARAWHAVLLADAAGDVERVRLLGRDLTLTRGVDGWTSAPRAHGIVERWGLVHVALEEPVVELFDEPDAEDASYVGAWLPPSRTVVPAGAVADNFLDVAHFPFVHAATFGSDVEVVPAYDVVVEPDGFRSVQEQDFDNPEDPGVHAGIRLVRQRRRATYVYRAPFQLLLRLEELDAGAVKTILFLATPEDEGSTIIWTKMFLHGIGGVDDPDAEVVAREVAFEEAVLAEDLALQAVMDQREFPLDLHTEMHVRADRLGVALRRALLSFVEEATA
jgi:phenylpropionate dioxygenase-like ring-hydroxylating dioxygenase large terminal subunit